MSQFFTSHINIHEFSAVNPKIESAWSAKECGVYAIFFIWTIFLCTITAHFIIGPTSPWVVHFYENESFRYSRISLVLCCYEKQKLRKESMCYRPN